MATTALIGALRVTLGLDSASFERGVRKSRNEMTGFQGHVQKAAGAIKTAIAGMVAWETVQQLRDMTRAAVDAAGGLGEQAAALGVSTRSLQEYRYAATQVGLEQSEMDKGLEQLTRRLGEAAQGVKEPLDALERLGISIEDIKAMEAGDVIPLIAEGMKRLPSDAERAAVAVDLFGRAGQKLATLLAGGAEGIERLKAAAHELGIVLSDEDIAKADDVADKLAALNFQIEAQQNAKLLANAENLLKFEQAVGNLKLQLIEALPKIQGFFDKLDQGSQSVGDWIRAQMAAHGIQDVKSSVLELYGLVTTTIPRMVREVGNWLGDKLDAVWKHVTDKIAIVRAGFFGLYDAVVGHSYIPDMVDGIEAEMARLDSVMVDPAARATAKTSEAFRAMAGEIRAVLDRLFPAQAGGLQYRNEHELLGKIADPELRHRAQMALAHERSAELGGARDASFRDAAELLATDSLDDGVRKWEKGLTTLRERAEVTAVRVARSLREMVDDTLGAFSRLTSAVKSGGLVGILAGLLGFGLQLGGLGVFGKTIQANLNRVEARAAGGPVFAGRPYLVGERGPELMVPGSSGRIVPSHRFGAGGDTYHFQGNLMTPEFFAAIEARAQQAERNGAGRALRSIGRARRSQLG